MLPNSLRGDAHANRRRRDHPVKPPDKPEQHDWRVTILTTANFAILQKCALCVRNQQSLRRFAKPFRVIWPKMPIRRNIVTVRHRQCLPRLDALPYPIGME